MNLVDIRFNKLNFHFFITNALYSLMLTSADSNIFIWNQDFAKGYWVYVEIQNSITMCFVHRFLRARMEQLQPYRLLVGLRLIGGIWKWTDGSPATNVPWRPRQPSGDGDCAELADYDYIIGINDIPCSHDRSGAICEVRLTWNKQL